MTRRVSRDRSGCQVLALGMMLVTALVGAGCQASGGAPQTVPWDQYIEVMDEALARDDFYAADLARRTAYLLAIGSKRWDALAAVGEAYVRFADHPGADPVLRSEARRVYRSAMFRARQQNSVDGIVRVSEDFAALGDMDVAREGLVMAQTLAAASDQRLHDAGRLDALADRLRAEMDRAQPSSASVAEPVSASATWTR